MAYAAQLPLALGSRAIASGLDAGLVGIKPGGVRTLVLPPNAPDASTAATTDKRLLAALPTSKFAVVIVTRLE